MSVQMGLPFVAEPPHEKEATGPVATRGGRRRGTSTTRRPRLPLPPSVGVRTERDGRHVVSVWRPAWEYGSELLYGGPEGYRTRQIAEQVADELRRKFTAEAMKDARDAV